MIDLMPQEDEVREEGTISLSFPIAQYRRT